MKKHISMILTIAVVLVLSGCGDRAGYAKDGYAEGRMGDTMHTEFFDYTVNSAYLCEEFEGYVPTDGYQLLVADVTVKNTFNASIPMFDTDFQVQWNTEEEYDFPITYYADAVSDQQLPAEYEMAVSEEQTGLLVYEVPTDKSDFSISYQEVFEDESTGDTFFVFFTAAKQ